jgi:peptide deformylase
MDVLTHPNPALGQTAVEVDPKSDKSLNELVTQMARTMYGSSGIGLAATQLGVLKRVIVYDLDDENNGLVALCNPTIVERSEERAADAEGCLSVPGITVEVERSVTVTCTGLTISGQAVTIKADGLHARLLQHEIDHLEGRLILDAATPAERKAALKRYREAVEAGARPGQTSI